MCPLAASPWKPPVTKTVLSTVAARRPYLRRRYYFDFNIAVGYTVLGRGEVCVQAVWSSLQISTLSSPSILLPIPPATSNTRI